MSICVSCPLVKGTESLIRSDLRGGNVFLLSACPGAGKTTFSLHFLYEGLCNGQSGLIVLTDFSPDDLYSMASSFGWNFEQFVKAGSLRVIDCFSWRLGKPTSRYHVENIANLNEVSVAIEEARRELTNGRFVLDSISSIILASGVSPALRFLLTLSARLKRDGFSGILISEEGVHDEKVAVTLRFIIDGVFDMKLEELRGEMARSFRIFSIRGASHETRWVPFEITQKGIAIK